jgi:hypothetical protein
MAVIGAKGFEATVAVHWQGDRKGFMAWLREHARFAIVEAVADVLLASGVNCVELDGDLPDDDRMFCYRGVRRRTRGSRPRTAIP